MYRDAETDSGGRIISESEHHAGSDCNFNTANDFESARRYVYDDNGPFLTIDIPNTQFDMNGIPFTDDDTGGKCRNTVYGTDGLVSETLTSHGTGAVGKRITGDDRSYERTCHFRNGIIPVKTIHYDGPGDDSVWKTDDEIGNIGVHGSGSTI